MSIENRFPEEAINVLDNLAILANLCQVGSFFMNEQQLTNEDIMKALDYQNNFILSEILKNQKLILERLDKLEKI